MKKNIIILIILVFAVSTFSVFAETLKDKGVQAYSEKKYPEAVSLLSQWLFKNPGDLDGYYKRGKVYAAMKKDADAIGDFSKVILMDSKNYAARNARGSVYESMGQGEKAMKDYNIAIDFNPKYTSALVNRCRLKMKMHEYDSALTDCTAAVDTNPDFMQPYFVRGWVYISLSRKKEALQDFREFLSKGGDKQPVAKSVEKLMKSLEEQK